MRRYLIGALVFAAAIAQAGCLFEPREPEEPGTATEQYPWVIPNRPKDVFTNLRSGLASNLDSNYERSLDPNFTFIPSDDALSVYPGSFVDPWTKAVELDVLTLIKTNYTGARNVQFGDANLNFDKENEQVGLATYEGPYTITLTLGDGSSETYAARAVFTIVQGSQGWVLKSWEDIEASGTNPTSGILRGALRS